MSDGSSSPRPTSHTLRLPKPALLAVFTVILGNAVVFTPGVRETPLRVLFAFLLAFFVPGFLLVTLLFPKENDRNPADNRGELRRVEREGHGLHGLERLVVSSGLSIAVTLLVGLIISALPWRVRIVSVLVGLNVFVVVIVLAQLIRTRSPSRPVGSVGRMSDASKPKDALGLSRVRTARLKIRMGDIRTEDVLNVAVILSLLLAAGSVAYGITEPRDNETELYLLTEGDNGDLIADQYPTTFKRGEPKSLYVGVTNRGNAAVDYTIVVKAQQLTADGERVRQERELTRLTAPTKPGASSRMKHAVAPPFSGDNVRIVYLLYEGSPPPHPMMANADEEVHLWVTVREGSGRLSTPS